MAILRQLRRDRQVLLARLTANKRALQITPHNVDLQAEVIRQEGELQAQDLQIQ
jgi:hypothetical protein